MLNVDETSDDDDEVDIEEYEKRLRQLNVRRRDVDTKSSDDESEAGMPYLQAASFSSSKSMEEPNSSL